MDDDLDYDKLRLALNAAVLEEVRIDVLQWVASFSVGPLPAEIIARIYEASLASKYECQGVENLWYRVNEQIRFSAMISACGVEHELVNGATSRDQSPCPSFQPPMEATENESIDYTQAMDLHWALDSEDIRYQGNVVGDLALDDDIIKRLSPEANLQRK